MIFIIFMLKEYKEYLQQLFRMRMQYFKYSQGMFLFGIILLIKPILYHLRL